MLIERTRETPEMSRNEMFLLLACVFAAAIMSGPMPHSHAPGLASFSLASAVDKGETIVDATMQQHSFDQQ